jgi:glutathione peroxidase
MFSKVDVNGENEAELYTLLKSAQPGEGDSPDVTWNFEKFLVDGTGNVVKRYPPPTTPEAIGADLDQFR